MTNQINTTDLFALSVNNNQITTNSTTIAKLFNKRHSHVLEKIENLNCSEEFISANFSADTINIDLGANRSRNSKSYNMTKDGFMFLVMGFTGKKAAQIKEAYINAFNQMAEQLSQPVLIAPELKQKHVIYSLPLKEPLFAGQRYVLTYNEQGELEQQLHPLQNAHTLGADARLHSDVTQVLQALQRIDNYASLSLFAPVFKVDTNK